MLIHQRSGLKSMKNEGKTRVGAKFFLGGRTPSRRSLDSPLSRLVHPGTLPGHRLATAAPPRGKPRAPIICSEAHPGTSMRSLGGSRPPALPGLPPTAQTVILPLMMMHACNAHVAIISCPWAVPVPSHSSHRETSRRVRLGGSHHAWAMRMHSYRQIWHRHVGSI